MAGPARREQTVESWRQQQPTSSTAGPSLARIVAAVGMVPAVIYGAAIAGLVGAGAGLVLWALACTIALWFRRFRHRRHAGRAVADTDPFAQLQRTPCVACGAPTLLDACLDCLEGPSPQHRRTRDDTSPRDEPDDPAR